MARPHGSAPAGGGTYALRLRCMESDQIRVGALGRMPVREADYLYVGSAFGPGGVAARVGRHRRREKPPHWHVDHLRAAARLREVWVTRDPDRRECAWARILAGEPGPAVPLRGFGASDCACPAHLFHLPEDLGWKWFRRAVSREIPGHAPLRRCLEGARWDGDAPAPRHPGPGSGSRSKSSPNGGTR